MVRQLQTCRVFLDLAYLIVRLLTLCCLTMEVSGGLNDDYTVTSKCFNTVYSEFNSLVCM